MTNELITFISNLALTLSFIVALIFGIAQVRASARDRRERLTLDTLRNFQTREFAGLMYYMVSHDIPPTREEMQALPADEQTNLFQFNQQMESLGILVAEGLIDIDLVEKTLGSFVVTSWEKNKSLILTTRSTDPFLSEYFQWLAEQIDERMRKKPRVPFYRTNASANKK